MCCEPNGTHCVDRGTRRTSPWLGHLPLPLVYWRPVKILRPVFFAGIPVSLVGTLVAACAATGSSHPGDVLYEDASFVTPDGSNPYGFDGGGAEVGSFGEGGVASMDGGHMSVCYDGGPDGGDCTCVRIASIGHEGVWGPCSSDSTTALQTWLNTQSTAKVDNYDTTKPTLTPDFLAQYDVLILQWMVADGKQDDDGAPWTFSADEISALKDWVNAGGGIVALNGYQCDPTMGCTIYDVTATNQLLSFTDIKFNADVNFNTMYSLDYCWGGADPVGAPIPDAGSTPPVATWDQTSPIGKYVTDVGAYVARSISSTSATVDCTDGTKQYAVHEQIGKGHIFAYGDEWVTYSGEWLGVSACLGDGGTFNDPYDPCYKKSPAQIFQVPQFWYNSIKYAASSVACFVVNNPGVNINN